ncbi:polysaccharide biosynthesis/export family protein [uncultured Sphingomonas sp.]|uniref:polysaccharide biosynthesis/export family protein n=1 Tax=uncultured Sphingomonas sp. TaxID=158754 RepID=UPI0035CAF2E7
MLRKILLTAAACAVTVPVASSQVAFAQAAGQASQPRAYRINPGDELEIYVWGEDRLRRDIKVLPDGTISFPLVGQVNALNKLPREVEQTIFNGLKSQYRETVPQVTVSVKNAVGMQFSIVGKVRTPGAFTTGRYVNVLEALALAGGPAEFADMSNVRILRKSGGGLSVLRVRLSDVLKGNPSDRDLEGLPQIESGDTVIVP